MLLSEHHELKVNACEVQVDELQQRARESSAGANGDDAATRQEAVVESLRERVAELEEALGRHAPVRLN